MRRYAGLEKGTTDERILGYLLFIARKYGFSPSEFFHGLIDACTGGFFDSGELRIERCAEDDEYANLRVEFRGRIVAQTRLKLSVIRSGKEWTFFDTFTPKSAPTCLGQPLRICDLSVGMRNVNLTAIVARHPVVRYVISKFTSLPVQLSIVSIADDTGEIQLPLWRDEQLPKIVKGMVLKIDKGYVRDYWGVKQLRIRSGIGKVTNVTPLLASSPAIQEAQLTNELNLDFCQHKNENADS